MLKFDEEKTYLMSELITKKKTTKLRVYFSFKSINLLFLKIHLYYWIMTTV